MEKISAGGIIFAQEKNSLYVLMVQRPNGVWEFPKGLVENGESLKDAAKREIEEETNIKKFELFDEYVSVEYSYIENGRKVEKRVFFFIGTAPLQDVSPSYEHKDAKWLNVTEAYLKIKYSNLKEAFKKAITIYRKKLPRK